MKFNKIFLLVLLFFAASLLPPYANAGHEKYTAFLKGASIAPDSALWINDPSPGVGAKNDYHINTVLRFDDSRREFFSDFTITVKYKITLTNPNGSVLPVIEDILTINYDPQINYSDIQLIKYDGYIAASLKIEEVHYSGSAGLIVSPQDVYLELENEFDRYYPLNSVPLIENLNIGLVNNELQLGWTYIKGAESYDLEWLFVDTTNSDPDYNHDYDFRNATRINLPYNHYNIPMSYPSGVLVFRVRGIGLTIDNSGNKKTITGAWTITNTVGQLSGIDPANYIEFMGLEDSLNWQYNVVYAEEGKRKEVITFYDGSLRNRQEVTAVNSDSTAIVGETVYDHLGRPAVKVLPAPTAYGGIKFYSSGVNISSMFNGSFNKDYFDTDDLITLPQPIDSNSNVSLSNLYYSDQSPYINNMNGGHYIPQADKYPYTQTRYLNDGTDRICRQSGAGKDFKLGSNHETKYYYGTPACQQELDRFFGNEVGDLKYYQKNLVVDANGQVSISYLDGKDRVIATGLSGVAPSMLPLDRQKPFDTIYGSYRCDSINSADNERIVSTTLLVDAPGKVYIFDYDLGDTQYCDNCFTCKDCYYHLKLRIRDMESGNDIYSIDDTVHDAHYHFKLSFPDVGAYQIYKSLSVFSDSVNMYVNEYTGDQRCVTIPYIQPEPCIFSCVDYCNSVYSYVDNNGTHYFYKCHDSILTPQAAQDSIALCIARQCQHPDSSRSECEIKHDLMVQDMTPGGQYYDNLPLLYVNDPVTGVLIPNALYEAHRYDWLNTYISNHPIDQTTFENTFFNNIPNPIPVPACVGLYFAIINPDHDTLWNWMRENWQPAWNDIMFQAHPEHCIYEYFCQCQPGIGGAGPSQNTMGDYQLYDNLEFNYVGHNQDTLDAFMNPLALPQDITTKWIPENSSFYYMNYSQTQSHSADPFFWQDPPGTPTDFNCVANWCSKISKGKTMNEVIQDSLKHFVKLNNDSTASVWYLIDDPDDITHASSPTYSNALIRVFQCLHDTLFPKIDSMYNFTGMGKFFFFRSVYQYYKKQMLFGMFDSCQVGNCGYQHSDTSNSGFVVTVPGGFKVRWIRNPIYDYTNAPSFHDTVAHAEIENCYMECKDHVAAWMLTLNDFIQLHNLVPDSIYIADGLYSICIHGCNGNQSTGALNINSYDSLINVYCHGCTGYPVINYPDLPFSPMNCSCGNYHDFLQTHWLDYNSDPGQIADTILYYIGYNESVSDIIIWKSKCTNNGLYSDLTSNNFPDIFLCPQNGLSPPGSRQANLDSLQAQCEHLALQTAHTQAMNLYNAQLADSLISYRNKLNQHCISDAVESFRVRYYSGEYQYTLYYYDQAGNLIKTVPPEGVFPITDTIELDSVAHYRRDGKGYIHPYHHMITGYHFNSLEKTFKQGTPDADTSHTFYDILGRVVVSQNAQQFLDNVYSYTKYDPLGRIIEVGQLGQPLFVMAQDSALKPDVLSNWITVGIKTQITRTWYDSPVKYTILNFTQENLRNRVAAVTYQDNDNTNDTLYDAATHYSYDIHGNVQCLVQEIPTLAVCYRQYLRTDYTYDLVSGKVNTVTYQDKMNDCYMHKYIYDADNRITHTFVSKDGEIWEKDAKYFYYPHGPLARTETGDRQVQGTDYIYTLQGWIKGVNSNTLVDKRDPGKDDIYDTLAGVYRHANFGKDASAYSLGYFGNDYNPAYHFVSDSLPFASTTGTNFTSLYNGNISTMVTNLLKPVVQPNTLPTPMDMLLKTFSYDALNRIKISSTCTNMSFGVSGNNWECTHGDKYYEDFQYCNNGNITYAHRYGSANDQPLEMDMLEYKYSWHNDTLLNNKLKYIIDKVHDNVFPDDIDNQSPNNYLYDQIGNLVQDVKEGIDNITWNVYGKVSAVIPFTGLSKKRLDFNYDAMGNRIIKKVTDVDNDPNHPSYDYYARDAQGNIMAIYTLKYNTNTSRWELMLDENEIYGSSRLGIDKRNKLISFYTGSTLPTYQSASWPLTQLQNQNQVMINSAISEISSLGNASGVQYFDYQGNLAAITQWAVNNNYSTVQQGNELFLSGISHTNIPFHEIINAIPLMHIAKTTITRTLGNKQFELTNHLGNVIATISDRKLSEQRLSSPDSVQQYYPQVISSQDYYAFGQQMPERSFSNDSYRFGFNGKEKVDEISGEVGTDYDFGERIYDARLGRWFSIDALQNKYPSLSPFQFTGNNPICFTDFDGKDFGVKINNDKKTIIIVLNVYTTSAKAYEQAQKAAAEWNSKTSTINGYSVSFQFKIQEPVTVTDEEAIKYNPTITNSKGKIDEDKLNETKKQIARNETYSKAVEDPIGNVYSGNEGDLSKSVNGIAYQGGKTANGKIISMNTHKEKGDLGDYVQIVKQEFSHLVGIGDPGKGYNDPNGVMKFRALNSINSISDEDVENVVKYAKDTFAGKTNGGSGAHVVLLENIGTNDGNNPIGVKNENK